MASKEEGEGEVTFKIPNKLLLYVALALGGGGAVWNRLEGGFLEARTERVGRATYETLAKTVASVEDRVSACEERLDALEEKDARDGSGPGSSPRPHRHHGGVGASAPHVGRTPASADGDGVPDEPASPPAPASMPTFDMVKALAESPNG